MERNEFLQGFSKRITLLLQQANMTSTNSKAKVKVGGLAEAAGCSQQMARRYVLGEALPDIDVTYKIAKWFNVSPGWLLFGEDTHIPDFINQTNLIYLEPEILNYIINKSFSLCAFTTDPNHLSAFILNIINDVMHIRAEKEEIFKVIDISINSAIHFSNMMVAKKNIKTVE